MGKKQSSFNMSYEFNNYGDKVYIKTDTFTPPQVSQEHVQLTPDYSKYALKVEGGNPVVLNPRHADILTMTVLGSQASVNNISLTKSKAGTYHAGFKVATGRLTDNPAKTSKEGRRYEIHYVWYFVVTGANNLSIRGTRSTKSDDNIVAKVPAGGPIKVEYSGDYTVRGSTEDDSPAYDWVKVKAISDIRSKQNWNEKEEKDGWVPRRYVREDIKRTIDMRRYRNLFVSLVRVDGTGKQENKNACETWYSFGNANLASTDICPQTNGRWHVQVGPGVLDWEYPDDGLVGQDHEFTGFVKYIDVYLKLKTPDNNKEKERILKCVVKGMKAHTFWHYPYDNCEKNLVRYKADHFKSDYVTNVSVDLCPGVIDSGLVQTGIRYPNANNESVVKESSMDFSIIEFFGGPNTNFGFTLRDYRLEKIVVNDDTITPNTRGIDIEVKNEI